MKKPTLSQKDEILFSKLRRATVDSIWSVLNDLGLPDLFVNQLICVNPDLKMVGRAVTLRYLPFRKDLAQGKLAEVAYTLNKSVADQARPGDVLVIDAGGDTGGGCLGDLIFARLLARGVAGLVCDGAVRDLSITKDMGAPIYTRGMHAAGYARVLMAVDRDLPVKIGGVTVAPGDILVGDLQGFMVIPPHLAEEVARRALMLDHEETFQRQRIQEDLTIPLSKAYPMDEKMRAQYEEWKKEHPLEP